MTVTCVTSPTRPPDGQVNQRNIDVSRDPAGQSCARTVVGGNGG